MAAGYHSNQEHSDGCLSTLQNVVVTFVVVIAMGVQVGGGEMHREKSERVWTVSICAGG